MLVLGAQLHQLFTDPRSVVCGLAPEICAQLLELGASWVESSRPEEQKLVRLLFLDVAKSNALEILPCHLDIEHQGIQLVEPPSALPEELALQGPTGADLFEAQVHQVADAQRS